MKLWTIYCHTHIESGRRYIGLTSRTMERRWSQHVVQARSSKGGRWHFPNAIRKYGPNAFSHEELAQCRTLEDANEIEKSVIAQYDTTNSEFGFNLAKGGGSQPHPIKNPWDDPKYRMKCTAISRARASDPTWRTKNSASLTGRRLSSEHCRNISKSRSQQIASDNRKAQMSQVSKKLWQDPNYGRNANRKIQGPMVCTKHGPMSFDQCYRRVTKNGYTWFMCKQCASDHNKRRVRTGNGVRMVRQVV